MKNRVLYEICKLQNLIMEYKANRTDMKVICPYCGNRTARVYQDKWECRPCHKQGTALELLKLVEEDYCEQHRMAYWDSKTNKGVEQ